MRGLVGRISRDVEASRSWYRVQDQRGRQFQINRQGVLRFDPYQGNWRPVVADTRDAPLHFSEAEALWRAGLKDEALMLWKGLRAMAMYEPDAGAAVRRTAAAAAQRINDAAERDDFAALDLISGPFAYFAGEGGETVALSDRHAWRLRMPGAWRFMRGRDEASQRGDPLRVSVHLGHNDFVFSIHSTIWDRNRRFGALDDFVLDQDLKRGLDRQQKRLLGFARDLSQLHTIRCQTAVDTDGRLRAGGGPIDADRYCAVLESSLRTRVRSDGRERLQFDAGDQAGAAEALGERQYNFVEFYLLRPNRGLFIELRFPEKDREAALGMMRYLLERADFGDTNP